MSLLFDQEQWHRHESSWNDGTSNQQRLHQRNNSSKCEGATCDRARPVLYLNNVNLQRTNLKLWRKGLPGLIISAAILSIGIDIERDPGCKTVSTLTIAHSGKKSRVDSMEGQWTNLKHYNNQELRNFTRENSENNIDAKQNSLQSTTLETNTLRWLVSVVSVVSSASLAGGRPLHYVSAKGQYSGHNNTRCRQTFINKGTGEQREGEKMCKENMCSTGCGCCVCCVC